MMWYDWVIANQLQIIIIVVVGTFIGSIIGNLIVGPPKVDDPYKEYLQCHPDLCKYLTECKTYTDPKCHSMKHEACGEYLRREWA